MRSVVPSSVRQDRHRSIDCNCLTVWVESQLDGITVWLVVIESNARVQMLRLRTSVENLFVVSTKALFEQVFSASVT